jgi:hypothetical protein
LPGGEASGAVDGVDNPDEAPVEPGRVVRRLLGKPGGFGEDAPQTLIQEGIDGDVGLGHRGTSLLEPDPRRGLRARTELVHRQGARLSGGLPDIGNEGGGEGGRGG